MYGEKKHAQILGENLKRIRLQKNISRKQLANAIGITEISFGKYERGESVPSLDKIFSLAEILNVTIADLLGENLTAENNKNFEYRLNHALFLATAAGFQPKEFEGGILISVANEVQRKEENGTVEIVPCVSTFKISTKEKFIQVIETSEFRAITMDITFSDAFNLTLDK